MYLFEILQQSKNIESQNSLLLPLPYPNKKTRNQNNISKYTNLCGNRLHSLWKQCRKAILKA